MIRLAGMTSIFPDMTLDEGLAALKRYGYEGLEARVEWGHRSGIEASLSPTERADVRKKVEDAGLTVCAIATGVRAAEADEEARAKHMRDLVTYVDLAADLGAPYVRTFGGQRPRDRELKYVIDYVVEAYRSVLSRAADRGVVVLMETHDDWSHSSEVAAVVERVDHPNLKVLWDIMHPQRMMEKPEETFSVIGALTRHLHAHDGIYPAGGSRVQMVPLGEGVFDHATPLRLLQEAGFDGYFSVEVIHAPGSQHDAEGVLRQYAEAFRRMVGR
ncbi:MAG: sugar phosphate isomerase/epimerase [Anaerolineae bacterium]|nr:sugar phosphate isomerase/epimerase [Anaerolineae bacterium]